MHPGDVQTAWLYTIFPLFWQVSESWFTTTGNAAGSPCGQHVAKQQYSSCDVDRGLPLQHALALANKSKYVAGVMLSQSFSKKL